MYSTYHNAGARANANDLVVTVQFQGTLKGYEYFANSGIKGIEPGDIMTVFVHQQKKQVIVRYVRASNEYDRLKRVVCRERRANGIAEPTNTTKTETTAMSIKITNQTLVNGRELSEYSDGELLRLLRETRKQIDELKELDPIPKKFQKKIDELEQGRNALIALLDKDD